MGPFFSSVGLGGETTIFGSGYSTYFAIDIFSSINSPALFIIKSMLPLFSTID
jgi:hypothetical protein